MGLGATPMTAFLILVCSSAVFRGQLSTLVSSPLSILNQLKLCGFAGEGGGLKLNYYSKSCPRAEEIVKHEVVKLYNEHGNTAVSWVRNLFHDCMVEVCLPGRFVISEQSADRSFGMRNFKYVATIKEALEKECPATVSCADIIALSAREDVFTGFLLVVAGAHSVGRVHCVNLVGRLYPTVDPTIDPEYAKYLLGRCPSPNPDPEAVLYSRNDRETPMIIDNMYYKNLLHHKGLLKVDQQLVSYPSTAQFVKLMAADNSYFYDQFSKALLLLSENNPLTGNKGEVRKDCRYVNAG
ncbi:hypothetical protein B296_00029384 [Ensete ventricosum]|uniref:Peroxidase n=1 Tax=Ensete ventricosum TaxID=4639 RepID=A0A426XU66_ENSVE|nr:hypothetical protein B296_00029384 [Ensete ventricosum]